MSNEHDVSRTAAYVAAGRAIGAREPDAAVRNPDYLAEALLGDPTRFDLDLPAMHALGQSYDEAMQDIETASLVRAMIVRTRFIGEALEQAIAQGATQLLILGAGLDTHACRCAPLLEGSRIYEVDRPATQAYKRERLVEIVGGVPANLVFVPLDIETGDLRQNLQRHGFDFGRRTCVVMEGLTMYLHDSPMRALLVLLASLAPGSTVVFDFVSDLMIAMLEKLDPAELPEAARGFAERFRHLVRDEPWHFGIPLGAERSFLEDFGFEVGEILTISSEDAAARYLTRADGSEVGGETMARVPHPADQTARRQAEATAYRIAEITVARRH